MGVHLWLDDKRPAPEGWTHALTARDAIKILTNEHVVEASLDHDLGHCERCTGCNGYKSKCGCECHWTGYSVALFMATTGRWPDQKPTCHSANPAGRANIEATVERYFGTSIGSPPGEFRLSWREMARAEDFKRRHQGGRHARGGAIGGQFKYSFTETTLGTIATISCASSVKTTMGWCRCRKMRTLTDFRDW